MHYLTKVIAPLKKSYYFGYKLHGICSISGVIQSIDITSASVHDIHMLKDVKITYTKCTTLGDLGYLSAEIQLDLFETAKINLKTPMRNNQQNYVDQAFVFKKVGKELRRCSLKCAINLELEVIMQKHLSDIELESYQKSQP